MALDFVLRLADESDCKAILSLARIVVEEGDAFDFDASVSNEELAQHWLPSDGDPCQNQTFVIEGDDGSGSGRLAGVCVLRNSTIGRTRHCASCAFAVVPAARGRGLGKRLCAQAVAEASRRGFEGIRLDTVVSTNPAAVRVCTSCGFKTLCTVPRSFHHQSRGMVDTYVMWHDLKGAEASMVSVTSMHTAPTIAVSTTTTSSEPLDISFRASGGAKVADVADNLLLSVGEEASVEPCLGSLPMSIVNPGSITWSVQPALPAGLTLDAATGRISGTVLRGSHVPDTPYQFVATLCSNIAIQVVEKAVDSDLSLDGSRSALPFVNEEFAARVEDVVNVSDLPAAPIKTRHYGDWMVWMVHRVWLNDPDLKELDFTSMEMPLGHIEKRIAPKLMQAIANNTHLEVLSLTNSNMQKVEALELGQSLSKNTTLLQVNLESNCLDSNAVRELAMGIMANSGCRIEALRVNHQKHMGQFFGRRTEEAIGMMMDQNHSIVKLGFECDDAHWRNVIDRALLRNNDAWRRRQALPSPESLPAAEERTLSHLLLQAAPQRPLAEVFPGTSEPHSMFRKYVEQNGKLPTFSQLQNFAKNLGTPVAYSTVAPLIKECRAAMLNSVEGKEVIIIDAFGMDASGVLKGWSETNDQWCVDILAGDGKRYVFKSNREPGFSVSPAWGDWLGSPVRRPSLSRAGG